MQPVGRPACPGFPPVFRICSPGQPVRPSVACPAGKVRLLLTHFRTQRQKISFFFHPLPSWHRFPASVVATFSPRQQSCRVPPRFKRTAKLRRRTEFIPLIGQFCLNGMNSVLRRIAGPDFAVLLHLALAAADMTTGRKTMTQKPDSLCRVRECNESPSLPYGRHRGGPAFGGNPGDSHAGTGQV